MIMHKVHTGWTAAPAGTRAAGGGGGSFNPRAVPRRGHPPGLRAAAHSPQGTREPSQNPARLTRSRQ
ncbi:hypothetical protein JYU34_018446 [Plutella xylostella]|uniref:Uncharacterized protein n=1 Tax=Plutella xylostella TaxID=51655 RepID=A0ABQ7Q1E9_PLUXY|nr:hypothetical protein JYU34_018446 [Plutella xylostella]